VGQLEDGRVLAIDGKTVSSESLTFAGSLADFFGYVSTRVHALNIVTQASAVRSSIVVISITLTTEVWCDWIEADPAHHVTHVTKLVTLSQPRACLSTIVLLNHKVVLPTRPRWQTRTPNQPPFRHQTLITPV
jgi:hypothetical protein